MRKNYLILLLTIFSFSNVLGQNNCNCQALIDWEFEGQILIYDKPNGEIIDSISHDSYNEDYIVLTIIKSGEYYLKAHLNMTITGTSKSGWIKKTDYIGTYARNYADNQSLNLYSLPDKNSKVESVVNTWIPNLYIILDCKGEWAKVQLKHEGELYNGWLEKGMQCANPYTTCN